MLRRILLSLVVLEVCSIPAFAQSGSNILLVANGNSPDSVRVAEEYTRARAVPREQVVRLDVDPTADDVDRDTYDRAIQAPISDWLTRNFAQDRILYIVLTKGVPLRIKGTPGREGTTASVDSELTVLYRRLTGVNTLVPGSVTNPYYLAEKDVALARAFNHADYDIYLVTRIDGFTVEDALALIDRARRAAPVGKVVLDERAGLSDAGGDQWLGAAGVWMQNHGFGERLVLESTTRAVTGQTEAIGYYSWGSNDPSLATRHPGVGFAPGAIAGMFVSTDARTFREPPANWKVTTWSDRPGFFGGSPQSLAGDLVRDGVTGASAYVAEPFLDATVRPQILFPAYLSGFNLAESFYLAMPSLSWQAIVLGDPLCAPFPRKGLQPSEIDRGIDPSTELPVFFSARSARALGQTGARPEAVTMMLRAEARSAKGDKPGSQKALEQATAIDARLNAAHLLLAATYEEQKDYDKAVERYRQVLANKPANTVALNNLAYMLAEHLHRPSEALAYAERAYTFSPTPTIADTLGWVQHLLGRDKEAARLLADAVRALPGNAEVRLHAAIIFAAAGMVDAAAKELAAAVRLDSTLEGRDDVRRLRERLKPARN